MIINKHDMTYVSNSELLPAPLAIQRNIFWPSGPSQMHRGMKPILKSIDV